MRSYNLSGANFVAYDDGLKPEDIPRAGAGKVRRQLAAMVFNKSTSRRVPMTMRMLVPSTSTFAPSGGAARSRPEVGASADLLEVLQAMHADDAAPARPAGTELLRLVPPRWNEDEQMFQLSYEGRACCMSNKNVQLVDVARTEVAALQIGKLRDSMFNVDFNGCVSPFQAFAAALAVFDQSSVRRRF